MKLIYIPSALRGGLGGLSPARTRLTGCVTAGDAEKREGISRNAHKDLRKTRKKSV